MENDYRAFTDFKIFGILVRNVLSENLKRGSAGRYVVLFGIYERGAISQEYAVISLTFHFDFLVAFTKYVC